jgi:hypothetical protein
LQLRERLSRFFQRRENGKEKPESSKEKPETGDTNQ